MNQDMTDVERVLEGDISAFENIVRRWQHPLINLAYRFCRDPQKAEEMAQDAFMQIYRKLDKFRGDSTFSTWVFSVSLNLYRSTMRRKSLPFESTNALETVAGGQHPQLQVEQKEREELIRQAVAALPRRYRDAVIMFYFREMDLQETAAILGISEGTAKAWLHRGRKLLGKKLGSIIVASGPMGEVPL